MATEPTPEETSRLSASLPLRLPENLPEGRPLLATPGFPDPPPPLPPPPEDLPPLDPAEVAALTEGAARAEATVEPAPPADSPGPSGPAAEKPEPPADPPAAPDVRAERQPGPAPPTAPESGPALPRAAAARWRRWWWLGFLVAAFAGLALALAVMLSSGSTRPSQRVTEQTGTPRPAAGPIPTAPVTSISPGLQAFASTNAAVIHTLSTDVAAVDHDSQRALEGDYATILADAQRLEADLGPARAAAPPADSAVAAQWSAALSQLQTAAADLVAAARARDPAGTIDALELMGPAGFALTPFTR